MRMLSKLVISEKKLVYIVTCIFAVYMFQSDFIERRFFVNEFISLVGMFFFIIYSFKGEKLQVQISPITISVLIFLIHGILVLILSFPFKTSMYFYFRNGVIVYSIFSFYFGYFHYEYIDRLLNGLKKYILLLVSSSILFRLTNFLGYFNGSLFFPLFTRRRTIYSGLLILVFFNFWYSKSHNQSTAIVIGLFFLLFLIVRNYLLFRIIILIGISLWFMLLLYFSPALKYYDRQPYALYGNINAVIEQAPILSLDPSVAFRLVIYYRLLIEDFPENMLGKGFGTPLLNYIPGQNTWDSNGDDENDAHVSGAHNTYITVFARLGIVSIILFLIIFNKVFQEYFKFSKYYLQYDQIKYFWMFFSISIIGFFNLALESPIYASVFWVVLGIVAKIIVLRKSNMAY